jgi:diguanylate cyclase (GGDEF)-like protein
MKKFLTHLFSSFSSSPIAYDKSGFWQIFIRPAAEISEPSARRQARLISSILLAVTLSMIIPVIYLSLTALTIAGPWVFIIAIILMAGLYILSRTKFNHLAGVLSLFILSITSILYVLATREYQLEIVLIFIISNTITLLISSSITSIRNTVLFAVFMLLSIALVPIILQSASIIPMTLTWLSNLVISIAIIVFAQHRNLMEKDRSAKMIRLNKDLQKELRQRKLTEDRLSYISVHDPLTDLPNRMLFIDRLEHAMERGKRHEDFRFAVFFLDLDRFKVVNDSLGHKIGDELLVESSRRIASCLRGEDTVARLGGDEFVVLLEDVHGMKEVVQVAERIQNSLATPFDLEGHIIFVFASMGIVTNGNQYNDPDNIIRDADIAMYRAKGKGLGKYEIFDPSMLDRAMSRLEMETDLRKAIQNQQFVVHYQPIIDIADDQVIGFEALVRWEHPTKGLIPPMEFIPTAEETGLIVPLGYWVLDEACRQIHAWNVAYDFDPPLTINVNLSMRQCEQPDLVEKIADILRKNRLDPSLLKLELTESLIIKDSEVINKMLTELGEMGIQVQIDDFGTGYSSLSYLHTLPIDTLKIDRSFISRLGNKTSGAEIVQTILSLAHNLGMKVVAEGVETGEQFSKLAAMKCEYIQGFLVSKAVDNLEANALLKELLSDAKKKK